MASVLVASAVVMIFYKLTTTYVHLLAPTQEAVVTLISCYPYRVDNRRIVVSAYLQDAP